MKRGNALKPLRRECGNFKHLILSFSLAFFLFLFFKNIRYTFFHLQNNLLWDRGSKISSNSTNFVLFSTKKKWFKIKSISISFPLWLDSLSPIRSHTHLSLPLACILILLFYHERGMRTFSRKFLNMFCLLFVNLPSFRY